MTKKNKGKKKDKGKHDDQQVDEAQLLAQLREVTSAGLPAFEADVASAKAIAEEVFGGAFAPSDVLAIFSRVPAKDESDPSSVMLHQVAVDGLKAMVQLAQRQLGVTTPSVVFELFDTYFSDFFDVAGEDDGDEDEDDDD